MKKSFQVENIKCNNCANFIKNSLKDKFGDVEVDLTQIPRVITLDIDESKVDELKTTLKSIGYPFSSDKLSSIENFATKGKSFISCSIGKFQK
jgi:copper chaperone CopZ